MGERLWLWKTGHGEKYFETETTKSTLIYILQVLVPEYLIKGESMMLVGLYVTGIVGKAHAELTTMSKGVYDSSGCARHRSVYSYISVKGSRVCKHCNVLAVRKYVRASMV